MSRVTTPLFVGAATFALLLLCVVQAGMWPDIDQYWHPRFPPAWWQLEFMAAIGVWLMALPSYLVYLLYPETIPPIVVAYAIGLGLTMLEILLISFCAYGITRLLTRTNNARLQSVH